MRNYWESTDSNVRGAPLASNELAVAVYDELRKIARRQLAEEQDCHTLQPTALINEAYLRLMKSKEPLLQNDRAYFLAAAAQAMRRILIEHARQKSTIKRGGGGLRVLLDLEQINSLPEAETLLLLDEALSILSSHRPDLFQLIQLRFFAGLGMQEAADTLQISLRTAERNWAYGKAWLLQEMKNRC